ncbi:MAG: hypothetical protein GF332_04010 [Candidatus Moranbacteria bacterium]|nr:hypothetical protein [Candidatus Moranbacteria bacterium]
MFGKIKIILIISLMLNLFGCGLNPFSAGNKGIYVSFNSGENFEQRVALEQNNKSLDRANVLTVQVDPLNHNVVYLGTLKSGVFKSKNKGETWQQITEAQRVYSIAIHPRNSNIIYIGGVVNGRGEVLKSTNAGQDWQEILHEPAGDSFFPAVTIDNFAPNIVWVGNTRGIVYRSNNQGESWNNLAEINGIVAKIVLDTGDTRKAYVRVHEQGLYKIDSTIPIATQEDENISQDVYTRETKVINLSKFMPDNTVLELVVDPNQAGVVYVATDAGILITKDGGKTWDGLPTLEGQDQIPIRSLAVAGQNSQIIYFGVHGVFYRSFDHGITWQTMKFNNPYSIECLALEPGNPEVVYLGIRDLEQK